MEHTWFLLAETSRSRRSKVERRQRSAKHSSEPSRSLKCLILHIIYSYFVAVFEALFTGMYTCTVIGKPWPVPGFRL
eukprot:682957-Rhodomonas_salina.1